MNWWLRIRLMPAVVLGLIVCMTLGAAAPSAAVPVPVLVGPVSFALPVAFLLPLIPACLLMHGQGRGDAATERVAVRSMPRWDALSTALLVAGATFIGLAETTLGNWPMGIAMARDFAGYVGLALLVRWLAGPGISTLTAALFPFVCASFGIGPGRQPKIWAWPLHDSGSLTASAAALTLFLVGLLVSLRGTTAGQSASTT